MLYQKEMPMQRKSSITTGSSLLVAAALAVLGVWCLAAAARPNAKAASAPPRWTNSLKPTGKPGPELHLAEKGKALYRILVPERWQPSVCQRD